MLTNEELNKILHDNTVKRQENISPIQFGVKCMSAIMNLVEHGLQANEEINKLRETSSRLGEQIERLEKDS
jgi:hypothetical protein